MGSLVNYEYGEKYLLKSVENIIIQNLLELENIKERNLSEKLRLEAER